MNFRTENPENLIFTDFSRFPNLIFSEIRCSMSPIQNLYSNFPKIEDMRNTIQSVLHPVKREQLGRICKFVE